MYRFTPLGHVTSGFSNRPDGRDATAPLSAQELSPATQTEPATASAPAPTWLAGVPASVANRSYSSAACSRGHHCDSARLERACRRFPRLFARRTRQLADIQPAVWRTGSGLPVCLAAAPRRSSCASTWPPLPAKTSDSWPSIPDPSELFARPPFPTFLNVSVAHFPDGVTDEQWVALVEDV